VKNLKVIIPFFLTLLIAQPGWSKPESEEDIPAVDDNDTSVEVKKDAGETKSEKPHWHGFSLSLGLGSNHVLNAEPENANWSTSYSLRAGWKLGKMLFSENKHLKPLMLSASFSFSNEIMGNDPRYRSQFFNDTELYTNNLSYLGVNDSILSRAEADALDRRVDGTQRRLDYSDINITLAHGSLFTIPGAGIEVSGSMGFLIPLSLTSRNVGLNTKWDTGLDFSRTFKVGGRDLTLSYGITFSYYFYKYKTALINHMSEPVLVNGIPVDTIENESVARMNEFGFTNMFSVGYSPAKKVNLSVAYGLLTLRSYKLDNCLYTTPSGEVIDVCASTTDVRGYDPGGRGRRDYQMFSAGVTYKALDYLTLGLTLNSFTPQLKANTEDYQQPFLSFDRNNYSSLMFNISYSVDAFYNKVLK
jgi:hypothetical protein